MFEENLIIMQKGQPFNVFLRGTAANSGRE